MIYLLFAHLFQNAHCTLQAKKATFSQDQAILEKNIMFTLDSDTKLFCEQAYCDKKTGKVFLQEGVFFYDPHHHLVAKCNQAELSFEQNMLCRVQLLGNVEVQKEDHLLLYASSITIFPEKDYMLVEGTPLLPVQMFDLSSHSLLTVKELEIFSFLQSGKEKIYAKNGIRGELSQKKLESLKDKIKNGPFASKKHL